MVLNEFPVEKIQAIARLQHFHRIGLAGTVPANDSLGDKIEIASGWHFLCLFITGSFTTLTAGPLDDGINHLTCTAIQNGDTKEFWADFIPLDHFLTPGRMKDASVAGAAASQALAAPPIPFIAFMPAGSIISFKFANDATIANKYKLTFHGIRIKSK